MFGDLLECFKGSLRDGESLISGSLNLPHPDSVRELWLNQIDQHIGSRSFVNLFLRSSRISLDGAHSLGSEPLDFSRIANHRDHLPSLPKCLLRGATSDESAGAQKEQRSVLLCHFILACPSE